MCALLLGVISAGRHDDVAAASLHAVACRMGGRRWELGEAISARVVPGILEDI